MLRLRFQTRVLLILLCIGIVMMRGGGAHLHYCFDGTEPPVTVHFENHPGAHHVGGTISGSVNTDFDVGLGVDVLTKKSLPSDLLLLIAVAGFALFLLRRRPSNFVCPSIVLPIRPSRTYLRPPLRGPPL